MKSILIKVDDRIKSELDMIREGEGLGNQTATITYLIKYYMLTKSSKLDDYIAMMDRALEKIDINKIPSIEDQLKDI
ncbi:MAG: hypothetical protein PHP74_02525 [Candidatus Gracilibacteria bacterium]|nr:hypothetical protein [Candidatus Gracilibacteria bacterium]